LTWLGYGGRPRPCAGNLAQAGAFLFKGSGCLRYEVRKEARVGNAHLWPERLPCDAVQAVNLTSLIDHLPGEVE